MTVKARYEPTALTSAVLAEIRLELMTRKWSVSEFARQQGKSQAHISAIVRGEAILSLDTLVRWCEVLRIDLQTLIRAAEAGRAQSLSARSRSASDVATPAQAMRAVAEAGRAKVAADDAKRGTRKPNRDRKLR